MSEIKETESITLQIAYLRLYKHLSYRSIARIVGKSRNAVHHRFRQFAMNYNASEHYKNLAHTWFSKKVSQNEKSVPNA